MQKVHDLDREQQVNDLVIDGLQTDLHRAGLRIRDLEAEAVWHRDVAKAALAIVVRLTHTVDQLRDQRRADSELIQELTQELNDLYLGVPIMPTDTAVTTYADVH